MARGKILNFKEDYSGDLFTYKDGSPRLWYCDEALWREREYVTTRDRPTEDMALLHIWLAARALRRIDLYRYTLTEIESRILRLEHQCLHENRHYSASMKFEWIAKRMGVDYTPRQVKLLLDDISDIIRRAEMLRVLDLIEAAEKRKTQYFKELVKEAIREECQQLRAA